MNKWALFTLAKIEGIGSERGFQQWEKTGYNSANAGCINAI